MQCNFFEDDFQNVIVNLQNAVPTPFDWTFCKKKNGPAKNLNASEVHERDKLFALLLNPVLERARIFI